MRPWTCEEMISILTSCDACRWLFLSGNARIREEYLYALSVDFLSEISQTQS